MDEALPDERLSLIFACCHPALSLESQVALTLRLVGGLTTEEIARAFLVPEPTMAQRLSRAKGKVRAAGIPIRVPEAHVLPDRLRAVHAVLYLAFNQGYGPPPTDDLLDEAIRLAKLLAVLMPDDAESLGLVALMLLHDARRETRVDASGEIVLLANQDRARWDRGRIDEGRRVLDRAIRLRRPGPYQLQAAIASLHADKPTDWSEISALYGRLVELTPSPVVELNRAVAVAMADGPLAGLALMGPLEERLRRLLPLPFGAGRSAAAGQPPRRGVGRVPARDRPGAERRRAALPRATGRGARELDVGREPGLGLFGRWLLGGVLVRRVSCFDEGVAPFRRLGHRDRLDAAHEAVERPRRVAAVGAGARLVLDLLALQRLGGEREARLVVLPAVDPDERRGRPTRARPAAPGGRPTDPSRGSARA